MYVRASANRSDGQGLLSQPLRAPMIDDQSTDLTAAGAVLGIAYSVLREACLTTSSWRRFLAALPSRGLRVTERVLGIDHTVTAPTIRGAQ